MRIVHLGHVPIPLDHPQAKFTGPMHPGRWVLNHAIAQKRAGFDVEVVAQAHKATADFDCEIEGVTVHFLRTYHPYRHFTFYAFDAWRMARFARRLSPDLIHAHGTEAAYGHAAVRSGLPFCVTAQGLFFKILPSLVRSPTLSERFLQFGENMVWKKTRFAIAKSEYGLEALRQRYAHLDISLIFNAYDAALENPVPAKHGHAIAFVGSINERKGFHLLVKTAERQFRDESFSLHVVGNAPEGDGSPYERETVKTFRDILGPKLVLHGKLPAEGVFSVLNDCRVIAAPSLEEMSGNQVTEGIMRGCHAVVFATTGVAGIVAKTGNASLVPWGNADLFADAVAAALRNPPSTETIQKAREAVSSIMAPSVVAAQHARLYRKILEAATPRNGRACVEPN